MTNQFDHLRTPQLKEPKAKRGKEPSDFERQWLVTLYSQGQFTQAEACAKTMTKQYPRESLGWKVLGAVLRQLGRTDESLEPMQKAVQLMPADYEAFNNLGVTLKALGKTEQAIACYRRALELKPDFAEPYGNLGDALRDQGKLKEALASFQQKLKFKPQDSEALHQVASLSGITTERAPDKYVEGVFDNYADKFDNHLQNVLQYDAPKRLVTMVSKHASESPSASQRVALDLGCGTGLIGVAASSLAAQIVGVDLSAKMLDKAKARGLYQRLVHSDLLTMMQNEAPASYDLAFAADVFIYIGKLDEVIAEVKRLLRPGGIFAFSIEALEPAPDNQAASVGYELQNTGRYRQSPSYINRLAMANGFTTLEMTAATIRTENHQPIQGYLVVWRG
ncbi:MAG: tetratricopeptide repeat protein [Aquabacterium sp.]|nr:tetratricopeptide repeat protein [Aquabacterium sp.]